jgi:L-asparaginase II
MDPQNHLPLVELTRGNIVESVHYGSVVVVSSDEKSIQSLGDANAQCFLRSSAKPFQALAFIEQGGEKHFDLSLKEIAIMCSSHSGTDEHVSVLLELQKKIGVKESDLQCGVHPPYDKQTQEQLWLRGEKPSPIRHNCSGKHTAMLAFAKMLGAPLENYLEINHPVQQAILKTFAEMCSVEIESIQLGTDGCSAPVFAIPLKKAALGFARLGDPRGLNQSRADACAIILKAMMTYPQMVAGTGRFDTVFMQTMAGTMMSKSGAEGYLGICILPDANSPGSAGLGLTLKISDGDLDQRAGPVAALEILNQLGFLKEAQKKALTKFDRRKLTNWRGREIGEIRPSKVFSSFKK